MFSGPVFGAWGGVSLRSSWANIALLLFEGVPLFGLMIGSEYLESLLSAVLGKQNFIRNPQDVFICLRLL